MKQRNVSRLGESLYEGQLENGLRVRVVPKAGFARKLAFLAVDFGSIDTHFTLNGEERRVPDGIAHYLEHKMFDMPEGNATDEFAARGASPNAFTSYTMTAYYFLCTEQFADNLRLLMKMVLTPYFTDESVEKERGIIAQEIKMYEDSADSRVSEDLFAAMYPKHPVSVPIAGSVESIEGITAPMLYACHEAFYQPSNMMLCVVGDVDAQEVLAIAEECSPKTCAPVAQRHYGSSAVTNAGLLQREMAVFMPTFCMGLPCQPPQKGMAAMEREIVGDLAAEILCGESSPLYTRLYEEGLIDSAFSIGYESVKDVCLLTAVGDSRDPEAVCKAILEEAERLRREGFEPALFERLKKSALGRRTRDLDSFESTCFRICAYELEGMDYFRFPEAYTGITAQAVTDFFAQLGTTPTMAVVYPNGEEEPQ